MLHEKVCQYCEKVFYRVDPRRKYCSSICSNRKNKMFGDDNPKAKSRRWHLENGYVVKNEKGKRIFEHRLVMEKHLGRKLKRAEVVHHIDGSRSNNKIDNLMLFPNNRAHRKWHESHGIGVNQYTK